MNWRRGSLRVTTPRTFHAKRTSSRILLALPLTLSNSGARQIGVSAVRLTFGRDTLQGVSTFEAGVTAPKTFFSGISIAGRSTTISMVEFVSEQDWTLPLEPCELQVEVLVAGNRNWSSLGAIVLHLNSETSKLLTSSYLGLDNVISLPQ